MEERSSTGFGTKIIAGLVLALAAWLLLKIVIGIVAGLATTVAAIVLVVAIVWAFRQF
jgi:hypothetical protein